MAFGGQYNEDAAFAETKQKLSSRQIEYVKSLFNSETSEQNEEGCKRIKGACGKFLDTDEYASGDKTYAGYLTCCDLCSHCGGLSGWIIALIIFIVLGVCASGAAAFWFFYWNRKRGGQEVQVEEGKEDTESTNTEDSKNVIEIPAGTY
ncbi:hypothetical protein CAEBREN_14806 [Caenorhabditis brenneri]|uniref:Uncharacterized protein n=1 Tax=Caenorhabditis brenneri TaxID=135651 RepID=G0MDJ8_CAEBE|nr:hypothetical protein CAEBREN_14806 [Caenorhabditis brenneri]